MSEFPETDGSLSRRIALKAIGAGVLGVTAAPDASIAAETNTATLSAAAIEGYTDRLSYRAGDQVRLHVSSTATKFHVEVARVGATREVVWSRDGIDGRYHPIPANASTHGCGWPVSLEIPVSPEWRSGYYSVQLRGDGAEGDAFFVVRPAVPGRDSAILLQLTTNTWNAYNDFGGSSLYVKGPLPMQGKRVSFDRPM